MRKASIVVTVVVLILGGVQSRGAPNSRYLKVTPIAQEQTFWCWAASAQMIMAYHGVAVSQCQQASDAFGLSCCGVTLAAGCNSGGWPFFSLYGFNYSTTQNQALSWAQIQAQIVAKRPIAFSWHYYGCDNNEAGHMMVLSGYKTTARGRFVRVNNPSPGDVAWHPYEYYESGDDDLCHWDDYYDIH